jgi:hypothetical protein
MRRFLLIAATLLALGGCLNGADSKKVDDATSRVFAQIQSKQFDVIYDEAAPEFQNSMSKDVFIGLMTRVGRKLGACPTPKQPIAWHVNTTTNGYFSTRNYVAACANGQLTQSVTIVLRNGQAKLAGYYVGSPLLLTD